VIRTKKEGMTDDGGEELLSDKRGNALTGGAEFTAREFRPKN